MTVGSSQSPEDAEQTARMKVDSAKDAPPGMSSFDRQETAAQFNERMALPLEPAARSNPSAPTAAFDLRRVQLDRDGYTLGGRYFGRGAPLYEYDDGGRVQGFIRAVDRAAAKDELRKQFPGAKFRS